MQDKQHISFQKREDLFFKSLTQKVRDYFSKSNVSPFASPYFYLKGGFMVAVYLTAYVILLTKGSTLPILLMCYMIMGAFAILIGLNVGHDAAHGSVSKNPRWNQIMVMAFDLLGANSFMWRNRHVFAHHPYPNILNQDSDIQQVPIVRIFPNDQLKKIHQYQHLYMPFIYLFYTLHWIMRRDFRDFLVERIGAYKTKAYPKWEIAKLFIFKTLYVGYTIVVPYLLFEHSFGWIFLGFLLMNFAASMVVSVALVSAHVGEDSVFPEVDESGQLPYTWAEHQVITTSDFATHSPIVNFLFGGFNHHVIHHLFPRINHVHYPNLTPLLVETAAEFGLPYSCEPKIARSVVSHWKLLKAQGPSAWESDDF